MGRLGDAAHAANRLARVPPWRARGLTLLGTIMLAENDPAGTAVALRTALEQEPAAGDQSRAGRHPQSAGSRLAGAGRPAEARDELRALLSQGSDVRADSEAWWLLSRAHLQEGALPEARESLEKAGGYADTDPTLPDPAPFVGSARCAGCHAEKFKAQRLVAPCQDLSPGRRAWRRGSPSTPFPDPASAQVTHTFQRSKDRSRAKHDARPTRFTTR